MSDSRPSLRVNSALLPQYRGQNVRLPCKPVKVKGNTATVVASDGGEVSMNILPDVTLSTDQFYEVLGSVTDGTSIKMLQCTPLGADIDMNLVDDAIKLMHDNRFYDIIFTDKESS